MVIPGNSDCYAWSIQLRIGQGTQRLMVAIVSSPTLSDGL